MSNKNTLWEFRKEAEPQDTSGGFWCDVADKGCINLECVLADVEQLRQAKGAIALLRSLKSAMEAADLIEHTEEKYAELATLRQKLAEAEKERDVYKHAREEAYRTVDDGTRELISTIKERDEACAALATAEAELKKCGEAVMTYVETVKRKNREIWAAEADCAAMREALTFYADDANHESREYIVEASRPEDERYDPCEEEHYDSTPYFEDGGEAAKAALARPTGQAILDELSAARKVCEVAEWQENGGLWPENYADALDAYRAARKANT